MTIIMHWRLVSMIGLNCYPNLILESNIIINFFSCFKGLIINLIFLSYFVFSYRYFDYLFYVDFETSMADQNAQNALRHLRVCIFLKQFSTL